MDVSAHINGMVSAVQGLSNLIEGWTKEACEARRDDIVQLNRDRLWKGLSHEGYEIWPSYAYSTIKYKQRRGAPFDRVTLRDYGDFYRTLAVVFTAKEFHVTSGDPDFDKVEWLQMHYGNQIYGFTEEDREWISIVLISDEVGQKVHDYVKK